MIVSTDLERELTLKLFKDFSKQYNSSNISKEVNKTRVGTFKALKTLEQKDLLKSEVLGKAKFYKLNLENPYARKTTELLLMDEANQHQRWAHEIKDITPLINIAILFGSTVKNEKNAKDTDLLLVYPEENNNKINAFIKSKNEILIKKIHLLKQTKQDLMKNIKNKDQVILDAIRTGIVLNGFEELVELIRHVTSQK